MLLPLEKTLAPYIDRVINRIYPQDNKYKHLILLIHIFHLGLVIFLFTLLLLPPKLQIYVSLIYLALVFSWKLFNGCLLTICSNYLMGLEGELIPMGWDYLLIYVIYLSLVFYLLPRIAPFTIIMNLAKFLERW